MPNRDRTGPEGKGPKTGRQEGNCEGAEPIGNRPRRGLGFGFGRRPRGFRRGFGRGFPTKTSQKSEKEFLKEELENLKDEEKELEKRIKEIGE